MSALTIIVGGGIAGLGVAAALSEARPGEALLLLEREPLTFSHSSGRNAAILRPLEHSVATTRLAQRSIELLDAINSPIPLLDRRGLLLTADTLPELTAAIEIARATGTTHEVISRPQLEQRCPWLRGGKSSCAIWLPEGGVIDIHGLGEQLRLRLLARGVRLETGVAVRGVATHAGHVTGVQIADGTVIEGSRVIIAAGAWSAELGASCGCPLPIVPYRRHLVQLATDATEDDADPVSWSLSSGMYLRREGTGVLACPGDHTPTDPGYPPVDPTMVERLAKDLPQFAPALGDARVHRAWACLRTMSTDAEAVVGADPRLQGLYWLTALGGFGMTAGLGAAELLARALAGRTSDLAHALSPARFC